MGNSFLETSEWSKLESHHFIYGNNLGINLLRLLSAQKEFECRFSALSFCQRKTKLSFSLQDNCSNSTYLNLTAQSHFNIVINIQLMSNLEQMARELFHFLPT